MNIKKPLVSERLDENLVCITAKKGNQSYLPTYLTDPARTMIADKTILVRLMGGMEFEVINGLPDVQLAHLQGRAEQTST